MGNTKLAGALLLFAAVLACPAKKLSASPPGDSTMHVVAHHSTLLSAPDTIVVTATCAGAAPNTGCTFSFTDTASGTAFASGVSVAVGGIFTGHLICSAPGAAYNLVGTVFGTASGYSNSATIAVAGNGAGNCPAKSANPPASTMTITVKSGG